MDIEKRVDRLEDKVGELRDFCKDEFHSLQLSMAELTAATRDRDRIFGKGMIRAIVAVILAVLGAMGIGVTASGDTIAEASAADTTEEEVEE
jgi:hypothetical protein